MAKGTGKEATGLAGQSAPPAGQCEEGAAAEAASASQCEAAPTPAIPAASSRGRRTEPRASRWWAVLVVPTSKLFLKCFLDSYLSPPSPLRLLGSPKAVRVPPSICTSTPILRAGLSF